MTFAVNKLWPISHHDFCYHSQSTVRSLGTRLLALTYYYVKRRDNTMSSSDLRADTTNS